MRPGACATCCADACARLLNIGGEPDSITVGEINVGRDRGVDLHNQFEHAFDLSEARSQLHDRSLGRRQENLAFGMIVKHPVEVFAFEAV